LNTSFTEAKLWNAGLYTRLSRDDGDKEESDSISNQKDFIKSFIKEKADIRLVNEYDDDGWSGVDFERPSFKRLLDDIHDKRINCVIVKDLSRLGRNYIETGKLLERFFPFMGVRFIAVNDNYDSQNPNAQTDTLIIPFKNLINDAYCADISIKIRSQLEVKRKKGEFIGSFAAYGYLKPEGEKNKLMIDEAAAPVVQDIFQWKISGMNQQSISNRLNELGILSPLEYKKSVGCRYITTFQVNHVSKWTAVAVNRILKNELYIGTLIQGITTTPNYKVKTRIKKSSENWVRIEHSHEPIISAHDFQLVAELMKKDTRSTPGGDSLYVFSGMLYCGDCGQALVRKNVPANGVKYAYHVCSTHKKGDGCKSHNISDKALQAAVFDSIRFHISECVRISRILSFIDNMPLRQLEVTKLQKGINDKMAAIDKLEERKVSLYEDLDDGVISKSDYDSFSAVFSKQLKDAEAALSNLKKELDNILKNRTDNCLWIEYYKKHHNIQSLTRVVVVELINRITVYENGAIDISFRYNENFEQALNYAESIVPVELKTEGTVD
jgi:DNA invertase Pin-like site-specific DNA recombinase